MYCYYCDPAVAQWRLVAKPFRETMQGPVDTGQTGTLHLLAWHLVVRLCFLLLPVSHLPLLFYNLILKVSELLLQREEEANSY